MLGALVHTQSSQFLKIWENHDVEEMERALKDGWSQSVKER